MTDVRKCDSRQGGVKGINPFAAGPIQGVWYLIWADRGHPGDHFGERIFQKE